MSRYIDPLEVGLGYQRKDLVQLWGLGGYQAISRGVFTPKGENQIFLFVTRDRESWMTAYSNFLDGDLLFWDGERGHANDRRIAGASLMSDDVFLFYRDARYLPFTFHGKVVTLQWAELEDRPSQFVFQVLSLSVGDPINESLQVADEVVDYLAVTDTTFRRIDQRVSVKTRGQAQRVFRGNLFRLWKGSCAVTGVHEPRVLRSSHIKPWAESTDKEKVDHFNGLLLIPNLDTLFNEGLISFRDEGGILISPDWESDDKRRMQISPDLRLRDIHPEAKPYLEFHRDVKFIS